MTNPPPAAVGKIPLVRCALLFFDKLGGVTGYAIMFGVYSFSYLICFFIHNWLALSFEQVKLKEDAMPA